MTYNEFIQNIISTRGQWNIKDGVYFERHHIIPKCLGGKGKHWQKHPNMIWLYPEEHFLAHKLLAEENPDNVSLVNAWWRMCNTPSTVDRLSYECSPEEYALARNLFSINKSKSQKEFMNNLNPEQKKQRIEKCREAYNAKSDEEKQAINAKRSKTYQNKSEEEKLMLAKKHSDALNNMSDEAKELAKNKWMESMAKRTDSQKNESIMKSNKTLHEHYSDKEMQELNKYKSRKIAGWNRISIQSTNTNKIYSSISQASKDTGVSRTAIRNALKGDRPDKKGNTWIIIGSPYEE